VTSDRHTCFLATSVLLEFGPDDHIPGHPSTPSKQPFVTMKVSPQAFLLGSAFLIVPSTGSRRLGAARRSLQEDEEIVPTLVRVGNNGIPEEAYPLQNCQGDCDTHDDCAGELRCFKRADGGYSESPPGCAGSFDQFTDFCFDPSDDPNRPSAPDSLYRLGNNGFPTWAFPLTKCMGDCDGDEDCAAGLKCWKRTSTEFSSPPGCTPGTIEADYCYDPADIMTLDGESDVEETENNDSGDAADDTSKSIDDVNTSEENDGANPAVVVPVVLGVLLLLLVGFWYSRHSKSTTPEDEPAASPKNTDSNNIMIAKSLSNDDNENEKVTKGDDEIISDTSNDLTNTVIQ